VEVLAQFALETSSLVLQFRTYAIILIRLLDTLAVLLLYQMTVISPVTGMSLTNVELGLKAYPLRLVS
jgi:hypothetical protein